MNGGKLRSSLSNKNLRKVQKHRTKASQHIKSPFIKYLQSKMKLMDNYVPKTNTFWLDLFKNQIIKTKKKEIKKASISDFKFHMIIGKGGFGEVWVVSYKNKKKCFALKKMSKIKIIKKWSIKSVLNEKTILSVLSHPFIVNMKKSF